ELRDLLAAIAIATAPLAVAGSVLGLDVSARFVVAFVAATVVLLGLGRRLMRVLAGRIRCLGRNLRNVVIVGDGSVAIDTATRLAQREALGYRVVEVLAVAPASHATDREAEAAALLARISDLLEHQPIDEVFFASSLDLAQPLVRPLITLCEE